MFSCCHLDSASIPGLNLDEQGSLEIEQIKKRSKKKTSRKKSNRTWYLTYVLGPRSFPHGWGYS